MRATVSLLPLLFAGLALGCQAPPPEAAQTTAQDGAPGADGQASKAPAATEDPPREEPQPPEDNIVRRDLVAESLPPIPALELREHAVAAAGTFAHPEGSDELAPRAAVALRDGLLLVGQAYLGREPNRRTKSWRWYGLAEPGAESSSTLSEPGAIRAAIAHEGGALLAGASGDGFGYRGWFAIVDAAGKLDFELTLESPNTTELFDLIPSGEAGELAVVAGYVDAQAWLVSLDGGGMPRWQRYVGSRGYTQIRGLARLDAQLLAIGSRAEEFGESFVATSPASGEGELDATGVDQRAWTIEGADQNQMLQAIVDAGEGGLFVLGTAKINHIQAHDQVLAVHLDRSGALEWAKVVPELRATRVIGGRAKAGGGARFIVAIPTTAAGAPPSLALLELDASGEASAGQLADSVGWDSAGFVEGEDAPGLLTYARTKTGLEWRRSLLPD